MTADAMFAYRDVCAAVLDRDGEYMLYVKHNRPDLRIDREAAFAAAESGDVSPDRQKQWGEEVRAGTAQSKRHGRVEARATTTATWLNEYLDWPRVGQVFRLKRQRRVKGAVTVAYEFTGLTRAAAGAGRYWP